MDKSIREKLSPREREIFDMLLEGIKPKEIAFRLDIKYDTVAFHRKNLYEKLGVNTQNEFFVKYLPESKQTEEAEAGIKRKKIIIKIAVPLAFALIAVFALSYAFYFRARMVIPNPIVLTFTGDGPIGLDGSRGWQYIIDRGLFFYENEWRASPYRLPRRERLTEGDIYFFTCTFTSDVDIRYLEVGFFDCVTGGEHGYYWTQLSINPRMFFNIEAGVEYSSSIGMMITTTASSSADIANRFIIVVGPKTENNPTLTFTQFEITKR